MDNVISKAYNTIKKAYTDRAKTFSEGDTKGISVMPNKTTGGSASISAPKDGRTKISGDFYSKGTERLPDQKYSFNTPFGDVEYGITDGTARASYTSPIRRTIIEGEKPYGNQYLGNISNGTSERSIETFPTEDSYLGLTEYTHPNGANDYLALLRPGNVSIPEYDRTINTPLGSFSLGSYDNALYAELLPSEKAQAFYNNLVNALGKRNYLNNKGSQL